MCPDLDALQRERYALFKAGLSPVDWLQLTRWQRGDLLARHQAEARKRVNQMQQGGLTSVLHLLVQRLLGL
jgi:hypothetical protein